MNVYIQLDDGLAPLQRCSGLRSEHWISCPPGCEAHFDPWADPQKHLQRTGENYSPVPNSSLASIRQLPGSRKLASWDSHSHSCRTPSEKRVVNLYRNDETFLSTNGNPLTVFVVTVLDASLEDRYSMLSLSQEAAASFYAAEVAVVEDDCDCDSPSPAQ